MRARTSLVVRSYAVTAAVLATLSSPFLALAYFATVDGAESLEMATVAAWAEPARDAAGVLVTFASPDRVYSSYVQLLALLVPALFVTAYAARARRPDGPRPLERRGWRTALTGYALFSVGLILVAVLLIPGDTSTALLDPVFLTTMLPGLLIALIGSTMLGIALLRSDYRPRTTAWLLAASFPLWIVGSVGLGHNSLGILPLFIAWAAAWRWRRAEDSDAIEVRDPVPTAG